MASWCLKHLIISIAVLPAFSFIFFISPVSILLYPLSSRGLTQASRPHNDFILPSQSDAVPHFAEPAPRPEPGPPRDAVDDNFRPIYFQDGGTSRFRVKNKPGCTSAEDFCVEDPDYDGSVQTRFDQLLQDSNLMNDIFADILVEPTSPVDNLTFIRSGGQFQSESPACLSYETIIYPKRGKTLNQDWVFILNQGETKQGIRVEKCYSEGSLCQIGGGGLQFTVCRQKYIYKKMLTMDALGSRILPESIYMPSCCICYIQTDFVQTRTRTFRNQTKEEQNMPGK